MLITLFDSQRCDLVNPIPNCKQERHLQIVPPTPPTPSVMSRLHVTDKRLESPPTSVEETGSSAAAAALALPSCDHMLDAREAIQNAELVEELWSGLTPLPMSVTCTSVHVWPLAITETHRHTNVSTQRGRVKSRKEEMRLHPNN